MPARPQRVDGVRQEKGQHAAGRPTLSENVVAAALVEKKQRRVPGLFLVHPGAEK